MRALLHSIVLAIGLMPVSAPAQMLDFAALDGWEIDNHRAALLSFLATCDKLTDADWTPICRVAADATKTDASARAFF